MQTADKSSKGVESPIKGAIECLMTDDNEHKEVHSTDFSPIRIIGRISCDEINEINKSD